MASVPFYVQELSSRILTPRRLAMLLRYCEPAGECFVWCGVCLPTGYGVVSLGGRKHYVHRVSYETFIGDIPSGLTVDHLCRNRACINPDHLEVVTAVENTMRGQSVPAQNSRKRFCKHGHPFDEANTAQVTGGRECRECRRVSQRKRWPSVRDQNAASRRKRRRQDRITAGRNPDGEPARGEKIATAKLTETDVIAIRGLLSAGNSLRVIGRLFGVKGQTIAAIRDGKRWKHVAG